jgi:hypothetical protein
MMLSLLAIAKFAVLKLDVETCNPSQNGGKFFGFPHWWQYINQGRKDGLGNCIPDVKFPEGIWLIALAGVNMLLYLAGIVAVVSIIYAGITYIMSQGNSEQGAHAKNRLINSIIGLVIVVVAASLVAFIGNRLG